jgi:hypothetical protein
MRQPDAAKVNHWVSVRLRVPTSRKKGDKCLYVSTGGFTKDAHFEAERAEIATTLINLGTLRKLVVEHYEHSDAETRAWLFPRPPRAAMVTEPRRPYEPRRGTGRHRGGRTLRARRSAGSSDCQQACPQCGREHLLFRGTPIAPDCAGRTVVSPTSTAVSLRRTPRRASASCASVRSNGDGRSHRPGMRRSFDVLRGLACPRRPAQVSHVP